jgi:IclR family transcriptional regulator, acetate operon repressor
MAKKTSTTSRIAPTSESSNAYSIRAVERVCDILNLLQRSREGVSLADVAAVTSLPKSSAFRYLSALEARRYVERDDETGLYRVGLSFQPHDTRQLETFLAQAEGALRHLRDDIGETTNLGTLDGPMVVHSLVFESNQMMRLAARVGDRAPIHSTALGKAMAAELPQARVMAMLEATGMTPFTSATITASEDYLSELADVRQQGFAIDELENQSDGRCVAVVLQGLPFPCGISVSAPAQRLTTDKVPGVVKQLRRVSLELIHGFAHGF